MKARLYCVAYESEKESGSIRITGANKQDALNRARSSHKLDCNPRFTTAHFVRWIDPINLFIHGNVYGK